jgi:O-antigen/teichoic acid export membrane protein
MVKGIASLPDADPAPHDLRASGVAGRIGRGLAANIGGIGVTVVIQFVSVPVLLAAWGVPTYGEWLVLSAVPTYVALSDLSFSSVAGNSMVMLVAQGKRKDAVILGRRLWSIVTVMTGFAVLAAVVIALVFGGAFGSGAVIPASEARMVLVALFLQVAVGNQYGVLDAWYRAGGRYPLGATMRQLGRLFEFGALMGAVVLGAGPSTAAIAFLAGSAAGFVVSFVVLRRTIPWSTFRPERPHLQTFRELLAPGVAFMAFPIGNALSLQGFTIVIGAMLGAAAVVVFSTTRTITRIALQAMGSINSAIWPELSRSVGSGRLDEARAIMRRSIQLALAASFSMVFALALFGVALIRWWTRGLVDPPVLLLFILLIVIVANSMWVTLSSVLAATNRHKRLAVVYLAGTIVALLGAVPLSSAFGLPGAATALLAIDVGMVAYALPAALRVVEDAPLQFLRVLLDVPGAVRSVLSSVRSST